VKPEEGSLAPGWLCHSRQQLDGFACGCWCEEKGPILAQNRVFGPAEGLAGSLGLASLPCLLSPGAVGGRWGSPSAGGCRGGRSEAR